MIWVRLGAGVSRCTCSPAAFRAPCMYVYVTCVCVKCVGLLSPVCVGAGVLGLALVDLRGLDERILGRWRPGVPVDVE